MELNGITKHITNIHIWDSGTVQLLQTKLQHDLHAEEAPRAGGVMRKDISTCSCEPAHYLRSLVIGFCSFIEALTIQHIYCAVICTQPNQRHARIGV